MYIIFRDQESDLLQRLKESEKSRREEQLQIEDRYTAVFGNLQQHMDQLKSGTIVSPVIWQIN